MKHLDLSEMRPVPLVTETIIEEAARNPNFHMGRLDLSHTDCFIFCYTQAPDAREHQWKLTELYHHVIQGGVAIVTNCIHLVNVVETSGMFYSLRVNIHHEIEKARKKRVIETPHHPLDWQDE